MSIMYQRSKRSFRAAISPTRRACRALFWVGFALCALPSASFAQEQQEQNIAAPVEAASENSEEQQIQAETGKQPPAVAPLGAWVRHESRSGAKAPENVPDLNEEMNAVLAVENETERKIFQELLQRYNREPIDFPKIIDPPKRVVLSRAQRKRLEALEGLQIKKVKEQFRKYAARYHKEPRGDPEMRLCSLNLDNYGLRDEVLKVLRKPKLVSRHRRKERELIKGIVDERCTVVAVQGVVGTSFKRANAGLEHLAKLLSDSTGLVWTAYLGASNHRLAYNGFLISNFRGQRFITKRDYYQEPLLRGGQFEAEEFFRGPLEVVLDVPSREGRGRRKVILITMHFHKLLDGSAEEPEEERMQMAESLRRIILQRSKALDEQPSPLLVVLGDRGQGRNSPSAQILEGRLRLRDFLREQTCKVVTEEVKVPQPKKKEGAKADGEVKKKPKPKMRKLYKPECAAGAYRGKYLFGVIGENAPPPVRYAERVIDGEVTNVILGEKSRERSARLRRSRDRTAEIYLSQYDLNAARLSEHQPLRYVVSTRVLKNLLPDSPLVRVDLNW